ncbi:hypothetical protein [Granulicella aggregans]|nr:hypothetical protein [Granulicella aggregans]
MRSDAIKNVPLLVYINPVAKTELRRRSAETGASVGFLVRRILADALNPA